MFECEDYNLTHAKAAQHAASTLMHLGRFEEAREWAERAAASYSGWGVNCHIEWLTIQGELEEAESLAAQMTQRYDSDTWYDWCAEVGAGDLEAAWRAKEKLLRRSYPEDHREIVYATTYHELVTGDGKAARKLLAAQFAKQFNAWDGMMLALLADRADDPETCDAALKRLAEHPSDSTDRTPLCDLAVVFQHAIESNKLDEEEIQACLQRVDKSLGDWSPAFGFFAGYFLATRGEQEKAVQQWSIPARVSSRTWARTLSWVWLREADVDPVHLEDRAFSGMFVR